MQKEFVWQNSDQRECTVQLMKKYITKNMRQVCLLDSNPLIHFHLPWKYRFKDFWHPLLGTVGMKPEHRRCSFKDRVLAPYLLKHGPKSYKFLHSLFLLPSRWTLQTILTLHYKTSINAHMQSIDNVWWRSCVLFHVWWSVNQKELAFQSEVWLYWGLWGPWKPRQGKQCCNHSLVFMFCGLCQKWKQPVAYYFLHRSTKGVRLVNFLMQDWKL